MQKHVSTLNFAALKDLEHKPEKETLEGLTTETIVTDAPSRPVVHAKSTEQRSVVAETPARILVQGPALTINRFKKLCKDDRRSYHDMLDIMMNRFEGKT